MDWQLAIHQENDFVEHDSQILFIIQIVEITAGDATTMPCKQIVIVMSAGSTAVLGAFDHLIRTVTAPQPVAEAA